MLLHCNVKTIYILSVAEVLMKNYAIYLLYIFRFTCTTFESKLPFQFDFTATVIHQEKNKQKNN